MCILFWTYHHPKYALVLCSNRDEFADRETLRAHRWKEDDTIIGGKDCVASGTWLAVSTKGKLAALTNVREPFFERKENQLSRGLLIPKYLMEDYIDGFEQEFLKSLEKETFPSESDSDSKEKTYGGLNLLLFDLKKISKRVEGFGAWYWSNRRDKDIKSPILFLHPVENKQEENDGFFGLSNGTIDNVDEWSKVKHGRTLFRKIIEKNLVGKELVTELFTLLSDTKKYSQLPNTGMPVETEQKLSSICIRDILANKKYGTRSSAVVLVGFDGSVTFIERDWLTHWENECNDSELSPYDIEYSFTIDS